MLKNWTAGEILAGLALIFMGTIGYALLFHQVSHDNHDYMLIILGALGGAMGVTSGQRAMAAIQAKQGATSPDPLESHS